MKNIVELKRQKAAAIDRMDELTTAAEADDRVLNEDETKEFDALKSEVEALSDEILEIEATLERKAFAAAQKKALSEPDEFNQPPTEIKKPSKAFATPFAHGRMKAFENNEDGRRDAYAFGRWLHGRCAGNESSRDWCRRNGVSTSFALDSTVDSSGGALVPEQFEQRIILLREAYGVFRPNAFQQVMTTDTAVVPRQLTGVTATFTAENGSLTESDPTWDQVSLTAKKAGVLTRMSTEVSEDAFVSLGDRMAQEFAYAFALKEDQCGFVGTGAATHGGIVGVAQKFDDDNTLAGAVDCATSGHDTFAEVDATDLATVMSALPEYARMNAKWYCSSACYALVFQRLLAASGGNTMENLAGGAQRAFLGYPVVISQVLESSTGTINNSHMLLFGDLMLAATFGNRRGITVATSTDRYFELDQIAIRATERFDINVHDVGDSTTAGPIVALIGYTS